MLFNAAASGLDHVQRGCCFLGNGQKYFDSRIKTFFLFPSFPIIFYFSFPVYLENLMRATHTMWELINMQVHMKIRKPSLHMTKHQLKELTYDQVERMKGKVNYQLSLSLFANLNTKVTYGHPYF